MFMRILSIKYLRWLTLALLSCFPIAAYAPATAAPQFTKPIIVGAQSYPWSTLGRVNTGGRGYCTGVLISERHVLSQARCLYNAIEGRWWDATELHFVAGYERERYRIEAAVSNYRVAPGFADGGADGGAVTLANLLNNWALITLRAPIGYEAGWMAIQWLDDATLRRYKRGEVRMLDAGYRRGQPHVVTVAPGCPLDGAGGRCSVSPSDAGLLTLLFIDGDLRVSGSPSMHRDTALKRMSLRAANQARPRTMKVAGSHRADRIVRRLFAVADGPEVWLVRDSRFTSMKHKPARAVAPSAAGKLAPGAYVIQLASFTSSETALRGQAKLQRRHAALLKGIELAVVTGQHDRLGTVYRLRTGSFAKLDEARALCASFRDHGQDCLVTKTH
jgi:hypothetical protein